MDFHDRTSGVHQLVDPPFHDRTSEATSQATSTRVTMWQVVARVNNQQTNTHTESALYIGISWHVLAGCGVTRQSTVCSRTMIVPMGSELRTQHEVRSLE